MYRLGTPPLAPSETPAAQLRQRLTKVDARTMKDYCALYLAPGPVPMLKTDRYNLMIERFRACSTYLLSLSIADFAKEHIALLPQNLPDPTLPRGQLVEILLKEEFGGPISEQLISLPSSEIAKERRKGTRRDNHAIAVAEACGTREEYIRSWPQTVPRDIVRGCLNAYYEGSQWLMPPICCVCSQRQHAVEMHSIVLEANNGLPDYLSILSSPYTNSKGPLSTSLQMMKNDPGTPLPPKGVHNGFSTGPLDAGGAGTSTLGMLN